MNLTDLPIGTRIYNHGDMCNVSHFGIITAHKPAGRFSAQIEITPWDTDLESYWVTPASFSREYKGHAGTRFVTEVAYYTWREKQFAPLKRN